MAIKVRLDEVMVRRQIKSRDLAKSVGITEANLSILKTGKARAIRFSTLEALCRILECQPGEILEYVPEGAIEEVQVPQGVPPEPPAPKPDEPNFPIR